MGLENLKILDFRNYVNIKIESFSDTNLIIGPNGSGKTNLLESIYTLLRLRPLRTGGIQELIRWNENSFYIGGEYDGETLEIGYSPQKKLIKMNHSVVPPKEIIEKYQVFAFMPEDLLIVSGTPDDRRSFMDHGFSLLDPEYQEILSRYQRTLRQRNAHLKQNPAQAKIWDPELIDSGSKLIYKRIRWMKEISGDITRSYSEYYEDHIELRYLNPFKIEGKIEDSLANALKMSSRLEMEKGYTLAGPHRDNFEIQSRDHTAKIFASQGQKRMLSLLLKQSLAGAAKRKYKKKPLLLLDDVLLELDQDRRDRFLSDLIPNYQTFLAGTSTSTFQSVLKEQPVFYISSGTISHSN